MRGGSRSQHVPRNRAKRPRTFGTEEAAQKWAAEQGIKKFTLLNIRPEWSKDKKIRIIIP
jgi:hypothetical protein